MFVSVDWVSFTFEMWFEQEVLSFQLWDRASQAIYDQFPLAAQMLIPNHEWTPRIGRAPYNVAQQRDDNGVMIFAHQRLPHSLVEISGIGCDSLGSIEAELALVQEVARRLTRLDIAVDIYTEVQPDEFASHREQGRFKAWSETVSASGHTVYVGSKSSDRYARIYRYFEPHPRSRFLRVEHVLKAEQAREAAKSIATVGIDTFVAQLGNTFGWKHEVWSPDVDTEEAAKAWIPERRQGKTVSWVYGTVMPLLLRLHKEGVLDVRTVIHELEQSSLTPTE